jgi:hypothetical protein
MNALIPIGCAVLFVGLTGCEGRVSYTADIKPIMDNYCLSCHTTAGEGQAASGFAVDSYAAVMKGTNFGPVIVPGSSISSTLYLVVASKTDPKIHMPPHHDESLAEGRGFELSQEHIETIAKWIDQGAQDN